MFNIAQASISLVVRFVMSTLSLTCLAAVTMSIVFKQLIIQKPTGIAAMCAKMRENLIEEQDTETTLNDEDEPELISCKLISHKSFINVPGCIIFNLTTNACRGNSLSYTISDPYSLDIIDPAGFEYPDLLEMQESQDHSQMRELPDMPEIDNIPSSSAPDIAENALEIMEDASFNLNSNHKGPEEDLLGEFDFAPDLNYHPVDDVNTPDFLGSRIFHQKYPVRSLTLIDLDGGPVIEWKYLDENTIIDSHVLELADDITEQNTMQMSIDESTNIGQCCIMGQARDIVVRVRCIDGIRKFKFKSAESCTCSFCRPIE